MTVLITGASRGIGAAAAILFARHGYRVVVNYARDEEAARAVVQRIERAGGEAIAVQGDVAVEADVVRLFNEAGVADCLVNNAGITGGFSLAADVATGAVERMLAVNVLGPILCSREAVRRMSTKYGGKGGCIVNVSSLVARTGGSGEWVHYAASKGAVNSLTIGLAREVAEEGIRVNAVAPGLIETDLHATNGRPDRLAKMAPAIPMRRPGSAEEVAEAIYWLASPAASYVTGTILEVGGGR